MKWQKFVYDVMIPILMYLGTIITSLVLVLLLMSVVGNGIANMKGSLFEWQYTSINVSLMPAFITTLQMVGLALSVALPLGLLSAVYLIEYARSDNPYVPVIRITTETLAGIPSIIYGLFGMLLFVTTLKWGFSLWAGAATLAIMVFPLIVRTTEEALKTVPDVYREGAYGLGAGKFRTIYRVVLPSAIPGILSGVILSVGRMVGETAALIYTAGTVAQIPMTPNDSGRTLAVHMYMLSSEGLHTDAAHATGLVLLVIVAVVNLIATSIVNVIRKGRTDG